MKQVWKRTVGKLLLQRGLAGEEVVVGGLSTPYRRTWWAAGPLMAGPLMAGPLMEGQQASPSPLLLLLPTLLQLPLPTPLLLLPTSLLRLPTSLLLPPTLLLLLPTLLLG